MLLSHRIPKGIKQLAVYNTIKKAIKYLDNSITYSCMDPKPFCLFYSTFFMTGGIFPIGQFLTGTGKILQDFQSLGLIFRGKIQPSGHQAAPFT